MIDSFRKHPVLSTFQVIAFVVATLAFFSTMSFAAAVTSEQARAASSSLPAGWSAGVMNHGRYYHWWTIQERPFFFGVSVFCLVASLLYLWGSSCWFGWSRRKTGIVEAV